MTLQNDTFVPKIPKYGDKCYSENIPGRAWGINIYETDTILQNDTPYKRLKASG